MVDVMIRPACPEDAPAIAKVHVDTWRTAYAGILPDEHLAGLSYERRERMFRERLSDKAAEDIVLVSEVPDQGIVGFTSGGRERGGSAEYQGEIYGIYVVDPFQRKGIGTMLTVALARELLRLGIGSALVWVLSENTACQFYERLGARKIQEKPMEKGGFSAAVSAYGWDDIRPLAEHSL